MRELEGDDLGGLEECRSTACAMHCKKNINDSVAPKCHRACCSASVQLSVSKQIDNL